MKPAAIVLVLSLGVFAGGAAAQSAAPWQFAEPAKSAPEVVGDHCGPCPIPWAPRPPLENPDAFLWSDYRGACIEHDLYRPRYLASSAGELHHSRPVLSAFGTWLDSLFDWLPGRRQHMCQFCGPVDAAHSVMETPQAPTSPRSHLPPSEAPFLTPVPPPEGEPPAPAIEPAPLQPTPLQPAPVQPVPIRPVPIQPAPVEPPPRSQNDRPPANEIPRRLIPPRTPVVELAPEPVLPTEPAPTPSLPRNRVPRPGQQLPRNAIPR